MKHSNIYAGYRYSAQIISDTVWHYHRFTLSFWDVEELLASRSIIISDETIRQWSRKFGSSSCEQIKENRGQLGDTWYLEEVFINIDSVLHYFWRALDQEGDEIDILVRKRKNKNAAMCFFEKLLKG